MRKELFFAILAGLVFGLIIAFGIIRANSSFKNNSLKQKNNITITNDQETPQDIDSYETLLTIAEPDDYDVSINSKIKLSGLTKPDIKIVISTEEEDYVLTSDAKGAFEQEIELTGGLNQILINTYDSNQKSVNKLLNIVYSSEFEKYLK